VAVGVGRKFVCNFCPEASLSALPILEQMKAWAAPVLWKGQEIFRSFLCRCPLSTSAKSHFATYLRLCQHDCRGNTWLNLINNPEIETERDSDIERQRQIVTEIERQREGGPHERGNLILDVTEESKRKTIELDADHWRN
jgi:hypothetical protein